MSQVKHSEANGKSRLSPVLLTDYRLEVPMIVSLSLNNLLEWFRDLRETVYLLNYWFIIKEYNSEAAKMEEMYRTRHEERAWSFHAVSKCVFPNPTCIYQPGNSQNPVLLRFYGGSIP